MDLANASDARFTARLTAVSAVRQTVSAEPRIGTVVGGRYRLERELGRGGMGVVYAGTQLTLDRPVAIKVLPAMLARDADVLRRFEREARAACRIEHPNVVHVFDLGRTESGAPYLAMELLEGHDLDRELELRGPLDLDGIRRVLVPLASALDALHAEGFAHRDIKPSNVFLARGASGITVKLVDFGLATLTSPASHAQRLTRVGQVVGTPAYVPPESVRGDLSDARGDVYSLGVMAFELLTARMPFEGEPIAMMLEKIARPAPTMTAVCGRPFSEAVERVIASALDRDPTRRPATASAFVSLLLGALVSPATRAETTSPPIAKPRPPLFAIALVVLAAITMSIATVALATEKEAGDRSPTSHSSSHSGRDQKPQTLLSRQ